jgi:cytochrome c oxidase subunit II
MKYRLRIDFRLVGAVTALAFTSAACTTPMDTLRPESNYASWIASIYWEAIGFYSLVLALVILLITLVLTKYSTRRPQAVRQPPVHVGEHLMIEAAWTVGPAAILLLMAFPAIIFNFVTQPNTPPANALHVQVIGHQWWWEFRYPSLGIITANEAHLPVHQRIYFTVNTADVIHSFWVPRLGGKSDLIPNHTNEIILTPYRVGEYYGQCAEFCGLSHANMRMRVFVDSPAQFGRWVGDQRSASRTPEPNEADYAQLHAGMELFEGSLCTTCHAIRGISHGPLAPDLTHFGSRTTLAGGTLPNTSEMVAAWIQDPTGLKPGANMPALALSPVQLANMTAYLRSLR